MATSLIFSKAWQVKLCFTLPFIIAQARRQDFAAKGDKNHKGGAHF